MVDEHQKEKQNHTVGAPMQGYKTKQERYVSDFFFSLELEVMFKLCYGGRCYV